MSMSNFENRNTVSVIIPIYNTEEYLEDCIKSIVNQTYTDLQIILVDDGSTDCSGRIADRWSETDSRITVIHQENQGLSAARNAGLDIANGKYIVFLDSDDWLDFQCFEITVKKAVQENVDIVLWSYYREYNKSKPVYVLGNREVVWDETRIKKLYKIIVGLDGEQLREPQKAESAVTVWGKLYRHEVINNIRFVDTKEIGTEDALFNIYVFSKIKRAIYLPYLFSHYRKTNIKSLTHSYKKELVYRWEKLYELIEQHLRKENAPDEFYQALNNRIVLGMIGLGLNLVEDDVLSTREKIAELKNILEMDHYKNSLDQFPIQDVPLHWKVFFLLAKKKITFLMYVLLNIMNVLRSR